MTSKELKRVVPIYRQLSAIRSLKDTIGLIDKGRVDQVDARFLERVVNYLSANLNPLGANQVTGLPGIAARDYGIDIVSGGKERRRQGKIWYVSCFDLDNFGEVDKKVGDRAADELLRIGGESLESSLREADSVYNPKYESVDKRTRSFFEDHGLNETERKAYHLHGDEYETICFVDNEMHMLKVLGRCMQNLTRDTNAYLRCLGDKAKDIVIGATIGFEEWDGNEENFAAAEHTATERRNKGKLIYGRGVIVGPNGLVVDKTGKHLQRDI